MPTLPSLPTNDITIQNRLRTEVAVHLRGGGRWPWPLLHHNSFSAILAAAAACLCLLLPLAECCHCVLPQLASSALLLLVVAPCCSLGFVCRLLDVAVTSAAFKSTCHLPFKVNFPISTILHRCSPHRYCPCPPLLAAAASSRRRSMRRA